MNGEKDTNNILKYILSIITITLCGELYFYPFAGDFRFSAGVIAIGLVLLLFDELHEIYLALFTGISILILRGLINILSGFENILDLLVIDFPGALYYLLFGLLFYILRVREFKDSPIKIIYHLALIDVVSNIVEALIRNNINVDLIRYILFIGAIRAFISYIIFFLIKYQEIIVKEREHKKRYNQLNTIISNLQSEIFYLTKSTSDIENVMSKAYKLYENTKGNEEINELALDLAREVHEIKKDYNRVLSGFKSYADNFEFSKSMYLNDIGSIIESNLSRYIEYQNKDIQVNIKFANNIMIKNYYYLFTIINNLITNSIDSIYETGKINVKGKADKDYYIIKISDNGSGISKDLLPYIFNPGFTTKYDSANGNPSTGIGLSHVQYIIDSLSGSVEVDSKEKIGSTFTVRIPLNELKG